MSLSDLIDRLLAAFSPMGLLFTCLLAASSGKLIWIVCVFLWVWNCACHTPIFVSKEDGKAK